MKAKRSRARRVRVRRRKVNKLLLAWRITILVSVIMNMLQVHHIIMRKFSEQPAVKRWVVLRVIDGVKYRVGL